MLKWGHTFFWFLPICQQWSCYFSWPVLTCWAEPFCDLFFKGNTMYCGFIHQLLYLVHVRLPGSVAVFLFRKSQVNPNTVSKRTFPFPLWFWNRSTLSAGSISSHWDCLLLFSAFWEAIYTYSVFLGLSRRDKCPGKLSLYSSTLFFCGIYFRP